MSNTLWTNLFLLCSLLCKNKNHSIVAKTCLSIIINYCGKQFSCAFATTIIISLWNLCKNWMTFDQLNFDNPNDMFWLSLLKKYIFSLRDLAKKSKIFMRSQDVQIFPITFDSSQSSQYWHACERLYLEYCYHRQRLPLYSDVEQNHRSKIAPSRGYLLGWKKKYHGKMA